MDGLELSTNVSSELGFRDGKVLGRALGALDGLLLRTYDGTELG